MTSTHIGTWAIDKLIRFALLPEAASRWCGILALRRSITFSLTLGWITVPALVKAWNLNTAPGGHLYASRRILA